MTLELPKAGEEKAVDGSLAKALRSDLGVDDAYPVFVPYTSYEKGGRRVVVELIEGYAFVASGLPETRYFFLEKGTLVAQIISSKGIHGVRVIHSVPDSRIRSLREQLRESMSSNLEVGTHVRVTGGNYSRLDGPIIDVIEDKAAVRITLRSIDVVAWIPLAALDTNLTPEEDPYPSVAEVFDTIPMPDEQDEDGCYR